MGCDGGSKGEVNGMYLSRLVLDMSVERLIRIKRAVPGADFCIYRRLVWARDLWKTRKGALEETGES